MRHFRPGSFSYEVSEEEPLLLRVWPWFIAGLTLLPFLLFRNEVHTLYWYGDEWDLMDQISRNGFGSWLGEMFAENFVPLFKLLWGSAVAVTGSYTFMLWLGWLTHAANVVLFARVLERANFSRTAALVPVLVFGLSSTNIETLVWSVQWSASLSTGFLLLALLGRLSGEGFGVRGLRAWLPPLFGLCSALCFSRGVLTGLLVGVSYLVALGQEREPVSRRLLLFQACVLPSVLVLLAMVFLSSGTPGGGAPVSEALRFALLYLGQNPLHRLLGVDSTGVITACLLLAVKVALCVQALRWCRWGRRGWLVAFLLALDLGNASLLGLGRWQGGPAASVSSRYQYMSLLCFLPVLGLCLEAAMERHLHRFGRLGLWLPGAGLAALGWLLMTSWAEPMRLWSVLHGVETHQALRHAGVAPGDAGMPGVSFITPERARELEKEFRLGD